MESDSEYIEYEIEVVESPNRPPPTPIANQCRDSQLEAAESVVPIQDENLPIAEIAVECTEDIAAPVLETMSLQLGLDGNGKSMEVGQQISNESVTSAQEQKLSNVDVEGHEQQEQPPTQTGESQGRLGAESVNKEPEIVSVAEDCRVDASVGLLSETESKCELQMDGLLPFVIDEVPTEPVGTEIAIDTEPDDALRNNHDLNEKTEQTVEISPISLLANRDEQSEPPKTSSDILRHFNGSSSVQLPLDVVETETPRDDDKTDGPPKQSRFIDLSELEAVKLREPGSVFIELDFVQQVELVHLLIPNVASAAKCIERVEIDAQLASDHCSEIVLEIDNTQFDTEEADDGCKHVDQGESATIVPKLAPPSIEIPNQSIDEDLELEFENEPSFEGRKVEVKRNRNPRGEYALGDELGRGKFGTVYRCVEQSSGRKLAAKFVHMRRREDRADVEREVEIMSKLQHKRLLQLYDAFDDGKNEMCLITELVEGGELFERVIDDDFELTEKKAAIFMRQICEGVEYMHGQKIVHLDMKPENILCVSRTGNRIKLIDFGLARHLNAKEPLRVMFGTPDFAAPEVLAYDTVSLATDMWSVGVICYVLLSGLSPFMGDNDMETMANVTRATYDFEDEAFEPISDLAKDFISKLLVREQAKRLKPNECLLHPWLQRGGAKLEASVRGRRESMATIAASLNGEISPGATSPPSFVSLDKRNLKKYVVRRKWHKTVHAIMALGRMGANLRLRLNSQSNV